ncbi:MAG: TIGR03643 family protein [Flavobacteriaceae bacterium]|nr:TIGR03643 family protein [Bacteroidia bacterium]MBT8287914.1 TIGR03643 family protein [Bacteroidia bacterium]NNF74532.1 TIGR03643 family protein [Flavobacteriaceae bacterium]
MHNLVFINNNSLTEYDVDRIIEMAWEDRTPFEAINFQFGLTEKDFIDLMRGEMKPSSFRMWRQRVQGRKTKHNKLKTFVMGRFKSTQQRTINQNKISKR